MTIITGINHKQITFSNLESQIAKDNEIRNVLGLLRIRLVK